MSVTTDIADALVNHLNGTGFACPFTAVRLAFPKATVTAADGVLVSVFVGPRTAEVFSRGTYQRGYIVYLVVQKKIDAVDAEQSTEIDALADLVEAIETAVEGVDMAGIANIGYDESVERLPYNLEAIRQAGVFAAIVGLSYEDIS